MVENFGAMNLEEQASSLSARGCLWLAVGGRQACEVTSDGTLLRDNRRLIGRSLIVLARKVQNNRD